jgi:hypothetical protein
VEKHRQEIDHRKEQSTMPTPLMHGAVHIRFGDNRTLSGGVNDDSLMDQVMIPSCKKI